MHFLIYPKCSFLRNAWLWKYLLPQQNIRWTLKSKHKIKIDPIYFTMLLVLLWMFHQFMLIQRNRKKFPFVIFDNFHYPKNVPPCILISMMILFNLKTITVVTWVANSGWLLKWEEKSKTMSLTLRGFVFSSSSFSSEYLIAFPFFTRLTHPSVAHPLCMFLNGTSRPEVGTNCFFEFLPKLLFIFIVLS